MIAKTILESLFGFSIKETPDYIDDPVRSEVFSPVLKKHRLLSAAWREHVGHTNPNKVDALPLSEAIIQAESYENHINMIFRSK